ncbi:[Fe-Fe] hydrogenase large subunit C-terminal domain-containing protein [Desnuesiella massiliensis]|uniref:[Fe-Fe] hydrogenase large subunit C-terminal domain-containing protein n=1 Tax=Desnuesiella massiliensis TaxID=1650662 RepID=UPI0006E17508|nr:[Fe-Fe] hydrogenase large subunit C-terminal domain-containing protein [Desnuesiella massiliensis]
MKKKYEEIFKILVKAYYDDKFEEKVNEILEDPSVDKAELSSIISTLCGVKVDYTESFAYDLRKAITNYQANNRIVQKISDCTMQCAGEDGKTNCQRICPFDAILVDPIKHSTYIDTDACTDCGMCVEACDSGRLMDRVEFVPIMELLKGDTPVVAAVAPAIMGQFGDDVTMDQLRSAFIKVGFKDMVEVAFFADMLTLKEAVEFDNHVKKVDDLMITSCCCPMWVGMLKRVYGNLVKHVSPSVSPMIAAGRVLKKLNDDCKVVFIGPCIAKKAEAKEKDLLGDIDYVLTFEELKGIFEILEISPSELQGVPSIEYASMGGRLYARTGGVSIAVGDAIKEMFPEKYKLLKAVQANGVKECKAMLEKAQNGDIQANFIEGMGCVGGCVGGPKALIPREQGKIHVDKFAENSAIKVATHSDCMDQILERIHITSREDFKNPEKIEIFERNF